jgi:U3 small nucleolar RNA-associated protein 4
MFGGLKGHMLQYLTRISVTVSKTAIVGIDFFYDDDAPVNCLQACPATATGDYTTRIPFHIDGPAGERLTGIQADTGAFASAHDCSNPYNYGAITSLKVSGIKDNVYCRCCILTTYVTQVTTNFKPVPFTFQPSAILQLRLPVGPCIRQRSRKAEIVPGMTLTGIYFMHVGSHLMENSLCQRADLVYVDDQDPKFGMLSMGCISEDLTAIENGLHQSLEDEIRCRIIG